MNANQVRGAFVDWARQHRSQFVFTGRLHQCLPSPVNRAVREWITPEKIQRNVGQFIERTSRAVFGRRVVRTGKKLSYVGAIEGRLDHLAHGAKRYHVHLGIGNVPDDVDKDRFAAVLRDRWTRSRWGLPDYS